MILAEFNLIEHLQDHSWGEAFETTLFGHRVVWMSSGIASMVVVALVMLVVIIPLARRAVTVPRGGRNVLEVVVLFVRDWIAKPALHGKAYRFMPFLLTQFLFFLGMNLIGLLPLIPLSELITNGKYPVGFTPTSILTVTGANAALVLVMILFFGFKEQAARFRVHHPSTPLALALVISPFLFLKSLVPSVPGITGVILWPMLLVIELASLISRCGALMIRLFANMIAGHSMLAVFLMFIVTASLSFGSTHVYVLSVLASVFVSLLEILVGLLQAFIFTFLTALFLGMYMEPSH